jgi:nucleoid-associated protein YgaU
MAVTGKLEKMLVLAFGTAEDAERGGTLEAKERFEALINPETYTLEYKVKTADAQGQGTSGAQTKFEYTLPEELTFDFLFDNTGLIDGKPNPDGVFERVDAFRKLLTEYHGDSHEPYHLKLVWGRLIFRGRAVEVGITYKLFNPDGQPIRAVVRVKFKSSIEEKKRAALEDRRSPDLTHRRTVGPGDTLPFMCFEVYGDPRHYLFVAASNRLDDFRRLTVGQPIVFPPLPPLPSRVARR